MGAFMNSPLLAVVLVVLAWWLSTGLILWRVRRADQVGPPAHLNSVTLTAPVFALGLYGVWATAQDASAMSIYLGFASALALWGWIEMAFLSGVLTGPNRANSPPGLPLTRRFRLAFLAIAWHEAALLAVMLGLWVALAGAPNQIASATFAILLGARSMAKINLFLGVPRINLQFIPGPISHLKSHFRRAPAGPFMAFSLGVLLLVFALLIKTALSNPDSALVYTVLASLTALAIIEHLFMVMPIPDAKLWAWMLPDPKPNLLPLEDRDGL